MAKVWSGQLALGYDATGGCLNLILDIPDTRVYATTLRSSRRNKALMLAEVIPQHLGAGEAIAVQYSDLLSILGLIGVVALYDDGGYRYLTEIKPL